MVPTILALCALLCRCSTALPLIAFYSLPAQTSTPSLKIISTSLSEAAPAAPTTSPLVVTTTITTPIIEITDVEDTTTTIATVTSLITVYLPTPTTADTPSSAMDPSSDKSWAAPAQMTDLSPFNISSIGGSRNLRVVNGIPAAASVTSFAVDVAPSGIVIDERTWNNDSSVLQLLYPANSINPGNKERPQGGAQFYDTPMDISQARTITMIYSVFFPVDFDFIRGGKLPGLTRMMWRKDGLGELYLYAPKDAQTKALCNDPESVCDAAYGLSIGRVSFQYTRGTWTTLSQTVTINTPGQQDACFTNNTLLVNGVRVIDRNDVYYRNRMGAEPETPSPPKHNGGLLGSILDGILRRHSQAQWEVALGSQTQSTSFGVESEPVKEVGFIGIFFSTFFGGHEDKWASPKDQYAWFKDFGLLLNS
ncbi:hypothetical protein BDZ89DRAFT_1145837 [Hymenopellis radicata]|nr:hypothetical protein BDZ89DRAFT_1145837 [Hymenopellis radicata]